VFSTQASKTTPVSSLARLTSSSLSSNHSSMVLALWFEKAIVSELS